MSKTNKVSEPAKKKHHRLKKLAGLALLATAAYSVKKYYDSKKTFKKKAL